MTIWLAQVALDAGAIPHYVRSARLGVAQASEGVAGGWLAAPAGLPLTPAPSV